jgi:hypothetical protein
LDRLSHAPRIHGSYDHHKVAIPYGTGLIFGFGYLPRGILFAPLENDLGVFGADLGNPTNHQGFIVVRLYSGQLLMVDDLVPASH